MKTAHTPGPWAHLGQGEINGVENGGTVDVCSVYLRTVEGRTEANARLIAAAPDLLAALIELEPYMHEGAKLQRARAAITKALPPQGKPSVPTKDEIKSTIASLLAAIDTARHARLVSHAFELMKGLE